MGLVGVESQIYEGVARTWQVRCARERSREARPVYMYRVPALGGGSLIGCKSSIPDSKVNLDGRAQQNINERGIDGGRGE